MKIHHFKKVTSTNRVAREYLQEGTVIVADIQTQGRARYSRGWHSPEGGLWCSIVIKHDPAPIINLAAALAVAKTFEEYGLKTSLKWPNDVLVNYKKICGILSETEDEYMIVGVGVDLNNTEFPENVPGTSYILETGKKIDKMEFLQKFVEIFNTIKNTDFLDEYRKYSSTIGSQVVVKNGREITGTAVDIDENGRLLLQLKTGKEKKIYSGEVFRLHQL
ncbi:MAG: biotin--[acetyl-CoA-carboxylase] ligase [Candidatus Methanofastidiosia archaeon]|jgi:BirA family biotin operon repressor/biotin-[acetyl-CoA-carboxylase] ligase